jgi:phosphoserine phosphatase
MTHSAPNLHHEALHRVLSVARMLGASANRQEILQVIIDAMRDTLDAERATVFEYDAQAGELFTTVAHGIEDGEAKVAATEPPRTIRFSISHGIAGEAARTGQIINVPDAYADARFNRDVDKRTGFHTRSILSIPLIAPGGELIGVAQVLNKRGRPFDEADEQIASALASQAAVAIKRGRLIEAQLIREKLERDLQLARLIQQGTIPSSIPTLPGFDIAAWGEPAEETGGDTYDIIGFRADGDDSTIVNGEDPAEQAVLLMVDATGHGVGPAIMATGVRAMLRMAVRLGTGLTSIIRHLNLQICQDVPTGRFVTAWIGLLDAARGTITSFSGGQAPLIHYRAADDEAEVRDADEMPFGIVEHWEVAVNPAIALRKDDLYVVLSDGIVESMDRAGEQFGVDRVVDVLRATRGRPAEAVIALMRERLMAFTESRPAADDRTMIVVRRTG